MTFVYVYSTRISTFNLNGRAELHSSNNYFVEAECVMYVMMALNTFNWKLTGLLNVWALWQWYLVSISSRGRYISVSDVSSPTLGSIQPPIQWMREAVLPEFYVLLTVHPHTVSQITPTRCIILFNIFIYFSSLHVSGIQVPIIRRKLLYLCDTDICHSVWLVSGLQVGLKLRLYPASRPDATHTEWQILVSHRYSNFLLMMGTWISKTCREEK